MARRVLLIATSLMLLSGMGSSDMRTATSASASNTGFSIKTMAAGNEFFAVGQLTQSGIQGSEAIDLPTGHRYVSCYYSNWYLVNTLPDGSRQYDIVIWNACTNQQVFPPSTCTFIFRGYMPSECVT